MRRILIFAGAGLGVLLILLVTLPFFIPSSVYKTQIEQAATDALGREVSISGNARISIFPGISASVEDVSVANPEGFEAEHMVEAGALRGSVRLWPLLSRRVEVSELSFEDASVMLTRRSDGVVNWEFGGAGDRTSDDAEPSAGGPFSASIDRARLRNATLVYEDLATGERYELTALDAEASLKSSASPMTMRANGRFQDEPFEFDLTLTSPQTLETGETASLDVKFGSNLGNFGFDGDISTAEAIGLNGQFNASVPQLDRAAEFLALELPVNLAPFGGLRADGQVSGSLSDLQLSFDTLAVSDDGLNVNFDGTVAIAATPSIDGNFSATVRNAYALSQEAGFAIPALQPIRQVSLDATLDGNMDALQLSNINAQTTGPSLKASYNGSINTAGAGEIDGRLSIDSSQLRTLLSELGVSGLPEGSQLKSAAISGMATGSFSAPGLQNAHFELDDTTATGEVSADLSGQKPTVVADLAMPTLDLTPFMGSRNQSAPASEWSEEPLDLEALKAMNARLNVQADLIRIGEIDLRDADVTAVLEDGRLNADFERFSAFAGNWQGRAIVDASASVPAYSFNLSAGSVEAESLLSSFAAFDRLSGSGAFDIDVSSSGGSISQIVNALDGTLSLDLDNGALAGLNLGQLVRSAGSLREAASSGNLTLQSLGNVVSPQAETDFTTFSASLNVEDGLASVQSLSLVNSVLDVSGAGQINLGGRTLDVKLTPAVDKSGQGDTATVQVNGIPVPLRIQGSWLSPQFSPDLSGLQAALTASARDKAAAEITDRIGGELGSIVSDAVSGRNSQETEGQSGQRPTDSADTTEDGSDSSSNGNTGDGQETPDTDTSARDDREKAMRGVLDQILGPK